MSPHLKRLLASALTAATVCLGLNTPAQAAEYERILNGDFGTGVKEPWWSSENVPSRVAGGRLCASVPAGGLNPWDAMIGQNDIPLENGQPYTLRFSIQASAEVTLRVTVQQGGPPYDTPLDRQVQAGPEARTVEITASSTVSDPHGQVTFQMGGAPVAYELCLDDISLVGGVIPPGGGRDLGSPVRVNQHGYLPNGPKRATVVTDATSPVPWRLLDGAVTVASGQTTVHGFDAMSGDHVHLVDFSATQVTGGPFVLEVDGQRSEPFGIGADIYAGLRKDALAYFYHNRSGTPIEAAYVGAEYARPAGHLGDVNVPCLPGACDYALDVHGGWYDAGDHGKYVVNGALAAWQLLDLYESVGDTSLRIPEAGNRVPDVLDEARWELEFLLRMQAPSGLVHHKMHDLHWTGLPLAPHNDPQPRYLHPVSTAATLNLAAVGARCFRLYLRWDPKFALRCLSAARNAWDAALLNPALYAPPGGEGGGAYDDNDASDEFSWAAAELFAATGKRSYLDSVRHVLTVDGFSWQATGGLADLALARVPYLLTPTQRSALDLRLTTVANAYVASLAAQGYANPYLPADGKYVWGSNSAVTNSAMILAIAYDRTGSRRYRDAVIESMDYLLGRNALNQSYVTGYGERASHQQHHRFWAHSLDPAYPSPAPGSLAGGPNSGLQDPVAQRNLQGCAPAKCYLDDIGSWSTNEVAINWNSSLSWIAGYADSLARKGNAS